MTCATVGKSLQARPTMNWITDHLPTEDDGDEDGDVIMPENGSWGYIYWQDISPGERWMRCEHFHCLTPEQVDELVRRE